MERRRYFKILLKNFLATSAMSFAVGYTAATQGVLQHNSTLVRFSLIFSLSWGLFAVGYKMMTEDDSISKPLIIKVVEKQVGIDDPSKDLLIL